MSVDCCYIAASAHDARLTRICVASVRTFYPDLPIRLLPGGKLDPQMVHELKKYWNIELAEIPAGDYGWGFVKLEPLFNSPGERFLILDSDTVMTGRIIEQAADQMIAKQSPGLGHGSEQAGGRAANRVSFIVDEEDQPESEMRRLYYNWDKFQEIDPAARRPAFVFNSGQWFGTSGELTREDFSPWIQWSMPPRLRHPQLFMPGDQGVLNYVLNQKSALEGLLVMRCPLMCWPGHGMQGISAHTIAEGTAPARIVHWAGLKQPRLRDMPGSDTLEYFERLYYARIPGGQLLRRWRASVDAFRQRRHKVSTWGRLLLKHKVLRRP